MQVTPQLYVLVLPLLAAGELHVEGLREGERQVALGPGGAADEQIARGRVIDVRTGFPVEGAWVETWTEEISGPGMGFRMVGEAVTGRDGGFAVRVRDGGLLGDKARVRKHGYLTLPLVAADLGLLRLVPTGPPTLLRVVDLAGDPIEGARVTSTWSCSHDHPAFERTTDADGRVALLEYGLQPNLGQLRVRAAGFRAIEYLDAGRVLPDREMFERGEPAVVRLARSRRLAARVLDEGGGPLAFRALHVGDGEGYHVPFTDADGRFAIESTYEGGEITIWVLEDGNEPFVFTGRLPLEGEVTLRVGSRTFPDELELATLAIAIEGERVRPRDVPLQLFHEDGWTLAPFADEAAIEVEFPPGATRLLVGGAFSGVEEECIDLRLSGAVETRVRVTARREPLLTVLTPPGEAGELLVQAGALSTAVACNRTGESWVSVPAGQPLAVLFAGSYRRLRTLPALLSELEGGGEGLADLRSSEYVLLPDPGERRRARQRSDGNPVGGTGITRTVLRDPRGRWVPGRRLQLFPHGGEWGLPGDMVLIQARSGGHAESWVHRWLQPQDDEGRMDLEVRRLAAVTIESELEIVGDSLVGETHGAVHPGPLTLTLRVADGRRIVLDLVLEAGERRRLRLRDR